MLYFSKLKVFSVLILTIILTYFAFSNFILIDDDFFKRKINLGLDLQGGSYLLLEVDNQPVVTRKLQSKVLELKKFFKDKNIQIKNVKINEDIINFEVLNTDVDKTKEQLDDDSSTINPYFEKYKSHQFDFVEEKRNFTRRCALIGFQKWIIGFSFAYRKA